MLSKHLLRFGLPCFLVASLLVSCLKSNLGDYNFAEHDAEFGIPVLHTTLSFDDLLKNAIPDTLPGDTLIFNTDGTMTLFYSSDVAERKATDIFTTWFTNGIVPVNDTLFYAPYEAPDSLQIFRADLLSGSLILGINNSTTDTLHGTFYVPQMTRNGIEFSIPFVVAPNVPFVSAPISLEGWTLRSENNTLFFRYEAYKPDGTRIKIPDALPGVVPGVLLNFQNMAFSYLEGYWGYQVYPLDLDSLEIDINKTSPGGSIKMHDPKVTVTVSNSFGFPTRGKVKYLRFLGQDGVRRSLQSSVIDDGGIDFDYPSLAEGEVGETKTSSFYFDRSNSNIADIFNSYPTRMIYEIEGVANATKDTALIGFLTNQSAVKFSVAVELTLEGSIKDYPSNQEVEVDFSDFDKNKTEDIEKVEFKLVGENEMPVAADLQVIFMKANGTPLDSLFINGQTLILDGAPVDSDNRPVGFSKKETFVTVTNDRFENIRAAKKAFIRTTFSTSGGGDQPVKMVSGTEARLRMGVKVTTKLGGG